MNLKDHFSTEEIRKFIALSDWKGWQAILFDWTVIVGSMLVVAWFPRIWTVASALILIGGRQLALAILVHEATHRSLFKTNSLNEGVVRWTCGAPVWQDLVRYRAHHMGHHQFAGTVKDPDISLVRSFPISKKSLFRKLLRDISGVTGIKRLYGLLMMDLGFLKYTIAADVERLPQTGRKLSNIIHMGIKNLYPMLMAQTLIFGTVFLLGKPELYLLWVGAYLTTFSVFLRIRSIAEHACTLSDQDPLLNTRTTLAGILARMTVAPHRVNYHLEHHLLLTIPYFRLPAFYDALEAKGLHRGGFIAQNYREVLALATAKGQ